MTDFLLTSHGSLCTLLPVTEPAIEWTEENLSGPEVQYWCGAVVVEPRYVGDIVAGLRDDGLTVE